MRDIIFFDTETTSVDIASAKIVQLAARKYSRIDMTPISDLKKYLFNPGIPIPPEVTEIHGITNEMVKEEPMFAQRARGIYEFFKGCDVAGHNVVGFDVPLLAEEFDRCGINWPDEPEMMMLDTYAVFREMEPRDLTAALKFYCGETLEGAHDAGNDVEAAAKVFMGQLSRYPQIEDNRAFHEIGQGKQKRLDLAGKIALDDQGNAVYTFGKGKGNKVLEDKGFGHWMLKQDFITRNTKKVLLELIGPAPESTYNHKYRR